MTEPTNDAFERLTRALAGHYRLERELGRGGMAVVYLAVDLKHDRQVAIKVLSPELREAISAERFLREIRIAAQLSHPHILPLYDSGDAEGLLYYVMPYVTGESLRQRLEREHQLPLDEALRICGEVASAIGHAHMHGVVHRDIKPENILLSGGFALVADFGIARAITTSGGDQLTTTGMTIGTPAYMSPEQAMAQPQIDGRSDQYSLACVLYEMLTGATPFTGPSAQAVLARHTLDPVPPIRTLRSTVPPAVEQAVFRALAKLPADRYPTATAFQEALTGTQTRATASVPWRSIGRAAAYLAGALALVAAGYLFWNGRPRQTDSTAVGILLFRNVGADPNNDYFSDGMSSSLRSLLGKVPGLSVSPRTSVARFKDSPPDQQVATSLGVRYLVGGSVERSTRLLKVDVTILDAKSGHEDDNTYEFSKDADVITVQDSIAGLIAGAVRGRLTLATVASLRTRPTNSAEAYDLYQQGRYYFEQRTRTSLPKALESYQGAVRLDSTFALAWVGLADTYTLYPAFLNQPPREYFPLAKVAAQRALDLDSTSAEVYTTLGFIALWYDWDWTTAERELDHAIVLDPQFAQAHLYRAYSYWLKRQFTEAHAELDRARSIEPYSPIINTRILTTYYFERRYDDLLARADAVLALYPKGGGTLVLLETSRAYAMLHRCPQAMGALPPEGPSGTLVGPFVYAKCGRPDKARSILNQLLTLARSGQFVSHFALARTYSALGDREHMLAELDSSIDEHAQALWFIKLEPEWDGARSDPRFQAILRRMGLADN